MGGEAAGVFYLQGCEEELLPPHYPACSVTGLHVKVHAYSRRQRNNLFLLSGTYFVQSTLSFLVSLFVSLSSVCGSETTAPDSRFLFDPGDCLSTGHQVRAKSALECFKKVRKRLKLKK